MGLGVIVMAWLLPTPRTINNVTFDVHSLLYAAASILVGFQAVAFSLLGKVFGMNSGIMPYTRFWKQLLRRVTLEAGLLTGLSLLVIGILLSLVAVNIWRAEDFGPLYVQKTLRVAIPAVLTLILGCQVVMCSFFFSVLGLLGLFDERQP